MRWLSLFLIALVVTMTGVATTQAAVAKLTLKDASAQEIDPTNPADPNYAQVKVTLSRQPLTPEFGQYGISVFDGAGKSIHFFRITSNDADYSFDLRGLADRQFRVALVKSVSGKLQTVRPTKTVTVKAPTPTPRPRVTDPTTGEVIDPGTTIADSDGCYKFAKTVFGDGICAQDFLTRAYLWAVGIAIVGAAGMIIYAGYKYTTSRGNPSEVNNAKEIIISTLVGLALLVLSFTILRFLGVNVESPDETNPPAVTAP